MSGGPVAPPPPPEPVECAAPAPGDEIEIERDFDIWNPGGDPGVLRAAAAAWTRMADDLEALRGDVLGRGRALRASWTGEAADGFQAHIDKIGNEIDDAVVEFHAMADQLNQAADEIQRINDEVHRIYIEIGATVAVGALVSVVTLGFGTAAAAASAAAMATRAATLVAGLANFLARVASIIRASRLTLFAARWAAAFTANLGARVFANAVTGRSPLDLSWRDLAEISLASLGAAGVTSLAMRNGAFAGFARNHRVMAASATGAGGNALGAGANEWALNGNGPGSPEFWRGVGIGAVTGGLGGAAGERLTRGIERRLISPTSPLGGGGRTVLGPDGLPGGRAPGSLLGPDGAPVGSGRPTLLGPDGRPISRDTPRLVGPDGAPISRDTPRLLGPDGAPVRRGGSGLLGPDGTPARGGRGPSVLGPDGRPARSTTGLVDIEGRPLRPAPQPAAPPRPVPTPSAYETANPTAQEVGRIGITPWVEAPVQGVGDVIDDWYDRRDGINGGISGTTRSHQLPGFDDRWDAPEPPRPVSPQGPGPTPTDGGPAGPAPADPPAPPPPVRGGVVHTVAAGDSLYAIADRIYGDGDRWPLIARANPELADPNLLRPGMRLVVPPVAAEALAAR